MQSFGKVCKGELIHIKIKKKYKCDNVTGKSTIKHNSKWPYIRDHPYKILKV